MINNQLLCTFKIEGNVCVDSEGHGFFMEDGDEGNTTFKNNFGATQIRSKLVPATDRLILRYINTR